jgi:hypothetical protein
VSHEPLLPPFQRYVKPFSGEFDPQRSGIELRIAPALETLKTLPANRTIDFAFIDADKVSYRDYYDALLPRVRPNGLILFDNVLWGGQVLDPNSQSVDTRALRALNDLIARDQRVQAVMISVSDGLTIVRKRAPDAGGSSGDDDDLAREVPHVVFPPPAAAPPQILRLVPAQ